MNQAGNGIKLLAVITLAAASCATLAQGLASLADVRKVTDEVMTKLVAGDIDAAFNTLRPWGC